MTDTADRSTATRLRSAIPTFLASDVGATARWYAEHFGFHTAGTVPKQEPYVYASVMRDGAEIMLLSLAGYQKPDISHLRPSGLWDAYIRTDGVGALYQKVREQPFVKTHLTQQSYGDWEFEVRDPIGYVLVFGGLSA